MDYTKLEDVIKMKSDTIVSYLKKFNSILKNDKKP